MSLKKTSNFNVKPKKTKKRILYQGGSLRNDCIEI